eukprot:TRINITY_DN1073_c0_g1_i5.p1 TRINITY_DN1073_c0_g1~~TRINITY_DN1073_c0_g1_i5.p1  ORF type:complete len:946 (+),score=159.11 TRINITY_DN1073_c0_g1_i5:75-2912(+)
MGRAAGLFALWAAAAAQGAYVAVVTESATDVDMAALVDGAAGVVAVGGVRAVLLDTDAAGAAAYRAAHAGAVEWVERDAVVRAAALPAALSCPEEGVTDVVQPYHLARLAAKADAAMGTTFPHSPLWGLGVTAYVLDTGVQCAHSELLGRCEAGTAGEVDDNGHGTAVAGVIAGKLRGVARSARVHSVKVLDAAGFGTVWGVLKGLEHALNHHAGRPAGAKGLINLSLSAEHSRALNAAVDAATGHGLAVVAAAGNSDADACAFSPASAATAITVSATELTFTGAAPDRRMPGANFGECVTLFAPGVDIATASTDMLADTVARSGTSMAAALAAGVAAAALSEGGAATPAAVKEWVAARALGGAVEDARGAPGRLLHLPCEALPEGWVEAPYAAAQPYLPRRENCYDTYEAPDDFFESTSGSLSYPPLTAVRNEARRCWRLRCTGEVQLSWSRFSLDDGVDYLFVNGRPHTGQFISTDGHAYDGNVYLMFEASDLESTSFARSEFTVDFSCAQKTAAPTAAPTPAPKHTPCEEIISPTLCLVSVCPDTGEQCVLDRSSLVCRCRQFATQESLPPPGFSAPPPTPTPIEVFIPPAACEDIADPLLCAVTYCPGSSGALCVSDGTFGTCGCPVADTPVPTAPAQQAYTSCVEIIDPIECAATKCPSRPSMFCVVDAFQLCSCPTPAPPTPAPPTQAPFTQVPPTPVPDTPAPPTPSPETPEPPTQAPWTSAPPTSSLPSPAPETPAPPAQAPATPSPPTPAPPTSAPSTPGPPSPAPPAQAPTPSPPTQAPATSAPSTPGPPSPAPPAPEPLEPTPEPGSVIPPTIDFNLRFATGCGGSHGSDETFVASLAFNWRGYTSYEGATDIVAPARCQSFTQSCAAAGTSGSFIGSHFAVQAGAGSNFDSWNIESVEILLDGVWTAMVLEGTGNSQSTTVQKSSPEATFIIT